MTPEKTHDPEDTTPAATRQEEKVGPTPGPWKERVVGQPQWYAWIESGFEGQCDGNRGVAGIQTSHSASANARLIAAAPELFEAAKDAEDFVRRLNIPDGPDKDEANDITCKLVGAIIKVTCPGRTTMEAHRIGIEFGKVCQERDALEEDKAMLLKALHRLAECSGRHSHRLMYQGAQDGFRELNSIARAAIAKATGEEKP